jgi:hypothetical protein
MASPSFKFPVKQAFGKEFLNGRLKITTAGMGINRTMGEIPKDALPCR